MSPLPISVEKAGIEGIRLKFDPSQIKPGHFFETSARVRKQFGEIIGCDDPEQIAIIPSVSYGMAVISRNTPVKPGDEIVVLHQQFPSNVYPWRDLRKQGARIVTVNPDITGEISWTQKILDSINRKTVLVALPNVHWADGSFIDLEAVGQKVRQVDAALVVDGTQSIGALPFDNARIRADAVVCGGYKWLFGPYSVGSAYFGERYSNGVPLEEGWMTRAGSEKFGGLVDYQDEYRSGAQRFNVGESSNFALLPMFSEALKLIAQWTPEEIQAYASNLGEQAISQLLEIGYLIKNRADRSSHLFGIRIPESVDPASLRTSIEKRNLSVSFRGDAVRVSINVFNTQDDMDALLDAFSDAIRK